MAEVFKTSNFSVHSCLISFALLRKLLLGTFLPAVRYEHFSRLSFGRRLGILPQSQGEAEHEGEIVVKSVDLHSADLNTAIVSVLGWRCESF